MNIAIITALPALLPSHEAWLFECLRRCVETYLTAAHTTEPPKLRVWCRFGKRLAQDLQIASQQFITNTTGRANRECIRHMCRGAFLVILTHRDNTPSRHYIETAREAATGGQLLCVIDMDNFTVKTEVL